MTKKSRKEMVESFKKYNTPLLARAETYIRGLRRLAPDRQPDAHRQSPETEWRRQKDIQEALKGMSDICIEVIKDLEKFGMYEEGFKSLVEEEVEEPPDNPCLNPRNYIEFMMCWQKWWQYLRRKNGEHQGYWKYIWGSHERLSNRVDEIFHSAQDRFDYISENCCDPCNCDSGTWTPTLSNASNLDGGTGGISLTGTWKWMRAGDALQLAGNFTSDPTSTGTLTSFQATTPTAVSISTFGLTNDEVAGVVAGDGNHQRSGFVRGVAGSTRLKLEWRAVGTSSGNHTFNAMVEM